MKVRFRVSDHGMGHVIRCNALAAELVSRGWEVVGEGAAVSIVDGLEAEPGEVAIDDASPDRCRQALLVFNGAAGADVSMYGEQRALCGAQYALLRREFRDAAGSWVGGGPELDLRDVTGLSAAELVRMIRTASRVWTYGGMRASEAACIGAPLVLYARNVGETVNAWGLVRGAHPDGRGCERVADALEKEFCG